MKNEEGEKGVGAVVEMKGRKESMNKVEDGGTS
jgi:hypothetical protein